MKSEKLDGKKLFWLILAAVLVLLAGILPAASQAETRPAIYNPVADMKSLIAAAVKTAGLENKNILLMFGGNWCPWCHRLRALFVSDRQIKEIQAST